MQTHQNDPIRKYEIYCDGVLHTVMSACLRDVQNALITLALQNPIATWEYAPLERRKAEKRQNIGDLMLF